MSRLLTYFIFFSTLTLAFSGCKKPPEYPNVPIIIFERFELFTDSAFFIITFKDGDGDIGLNPENVTLEDS